jgi:hypothetical protein
MHLTRALLLRFKRHRAELVVPALEGLVIAEVALQQLEPAGVLLLGLPVQAVNLVHQGLVAALERPDVVGEVVLEKGGVNAPALHEEFRCQIWGFEAGILEQGGR